MDRVEAEEIYQDLLDAFHSSEQSVEVDFRGLVPSVATAERATHLVHSYPAKVLRHIPALVVASPQVCPDEAKILDPFCGSGTTLVEAFLANHTAIGIDVNPLAVLISKVKTTPLDTEAAGTQLQAVIKRAREGRASKKINRERLEYWYLDGRLDELEGIRHAVMRVKSDGIRDAFKVALSTTARGVSLANPRVSVPVRLRPEAYPPEHILRKKLTDHLISLRTVDVISVFEANALKTLERLNRLGPPQHIQSVAAAVGDARDLQVGQPSEVIPSQVDLILTSPPYLGAQKYIRATSLNLLSLDMANSEELFDLQRSSIGREHFRKEQYDQVITSGVPAADHLIAQCRRINPLRAHLAAEYLRDMRAALTSMVRYLRKGGVLVLIAGGNHLCGEEFDTPSYLRSLCEELDLSLELHLTDAIRSRGLMTRRNRQASPIASECVMFFRK